MATNTFYVGPLGRAVAIIAPSWIASAAGRDCPHMLIDHYVPRIAPTAGSWDSSKATVFVLA
jgi:hypothetical protein